jgi:hypothetical protein
LLVWQGSQLSMPDIDRARALAEFDERYLHRVREPR